MPSHARTPFLSLTALRLLMGGLLLGALFTSSKAIATPEQDAETKESADELAETKALHKAAKKAAKEEDEEGRKQGWVPGLNLEAELNLDNNYKVVGTQDGTTLDMAALIEAALDFNSGIHEWKTELRANAGVTLSPSSGGFEKTEDTFTFSSTYLAHIIEPTGPYARVAIRTTMFPSLSINETTQHFAITQTDGTVKTVDSKRLALTDPFQPITFKQSIGWFVNPVDEDHLDLEIRGGAGAHETIAAGQFAVVDDPTTVGTIEVQQLKNSFQAGAEAAVEASGEIDNDKRISYEVGIGALLPIGHSALEPGDERTRPELTYVEAMAELNVKIFTWASINYRLDVLRQPLVIDRTQVTNLLVLTLGGAWGSKAPKEKPKPVCACDAKTPAATTPAPAAAPAPATKEESGDENGAQAK